MLKLVDWQLHLHWHTVVPRHGHATKQAHDSSLGCGETIVFVTPWPMLSAGCRNVQDSGDVWGASEPGDGSMSELW